MRPDELRKIWELRYAGKVSEALALLPSLRPGTAEERAEVALLNASFARHGSNLAEAFEWIAKAKAELESAGQRSSFQLSMQTAICLDVQSKFAESLSLYQESLQLARTEFERVLAKVNLAICRYNLSLPFSDLLAELGDLGTHPLAGTVDQLRLIELKKFLHEGKLREATQLEFPALSQGLYLQAWIESLPWFASEKAHLQRFRELASSEKDYFQKGYLLQTLQADPRLSRSDDEEVPVQERADRIYLWTWRWLENPVTVTATLLGAELSRFPFDTAHLTMTDEDFHLLRASGAWLSLFSPAFAARFQTWSEKYFPQLPESKFFERELALAEAVGSGRFETMKELLKGEPSLLALLTNLARAHHEKPETSPNRLLVRLSDFTLSSGGESVTSEAGTKLLASLAKEGSLSFERCAAEVFGIHSYDSLDHGPKIHNLLQRLKKLLPNGTSLSTKNERIYCEGIEGLVILQGSPHTRCFPAVEWPEFDKKQSVSLEKKQAVEYKAKILLAFAEKKSLSRAEIQKALALSKATTARLLLGWAQEGFLKAKGMGAARFYELFDK